MRPYDPQGKSDTDVDDYETTLIRPHLTSDASTDAYAMDTHDTGDTGDTGMTGMTGSDDHVEGTAEIRAEIEQSRVEMSQTINAIQEKLNPQVLMEQAKDTLHDATADVLAQAKEKVMDTTSDIVENTKDSVREATVGRVEDMVTTVTDTAKEASTNIVDLIKANPIPAALAGLGLGWLFTRGQSSSGYRYSSHQGYPHQDYNYGGYSGYPQRMGGGMYNQPQNMPGQVLDTIRQNPVPAALAGLGATWFLNNRAGGSSNEDYSPGKGYTSGSYGEDPSIGDAVGRAQDKVGEIAGQVGDKVGDFAGQAGNVVGQFAGNAQETAGDVAGRVTDTAGYVAEQTGDIAGQLLKTIKENPIPAALAGLSLGWLFMGSKGGSSQRSTQYRYDSGRKGYNYNPDYRGSNKSEGGVGDTLGRAGDKVGDVAGQVGSTVGDVAGQVGQTAGDVVGNVRDTVGGIASGVQHKAQRVPNQVERMLNETPLAVGAAAVAAGAALGLLVPGTEQERRLMGETRDNLMGQAQNAAGDAMDKVKRVTEQVAEQAGNTLQQEAQNQGITS